MSELIHELAGFPVFWVIGGLLALALAILVVASAARFPATVASLLVAATILAGFSIRPSGIHEPLEVTDGQTTQP